MDQLKRQAKELLAEFLAAEESAVAEVHRFYRDADAAKFALHDAQLVLARSYGFDSWPKLKAYVDGMTVKRLVEYLRANASFRRFGAECSQPVTEGRRQRGNGGDRGGFLCRDDRAGGQERTEHRGSRETPHPCDCNSPAARLSRVRDVAEVGSVART
jgi:hypothetical protein